MPAAIGLLLFVAALVWLYQAKARDRARCASILGLTVIPRGEQRRGTTSEGCDFHESVVMAGTIESARVEVAERIVRFPIGARAKRNRGSYFTVLSFLDAAPVASFRLQPVGLLGTLEEFLHDPPPTVLTGDAEFDAAFRLYAVDATAVLLVINSERRRALLALRATVAGFRPSSPAGKLASGLLVGTLECAGGRLSYAVFGTPNAVIGQHLAQAARVLGALR